MRRSSKQGDAWTQAWTKRYGEAPRARRGGRLRGRLGGGQGPWVLATALVLAVVVSPLAVAATKAISGSTARFTSKNGRYTELVRNTNSGDGGAAADACNSNTGNEPCLNMVNKGTGQAAAFRTRGLVGFRLQTSGQGTATPFELDPNATGKVTYLNADSVDGLDSAQLKISNFQQVSNTSGGGTASPKSATVECPAGTQLISQGGSVNGGGDKVALIRTAPASATGAIATATQVRDIATPEAYSVTVTASCATLPPATP